MKKELKHITHYLPYGLKIMVHDDFEMEMTHKRIQDSFEDDLKFISVDGVIEDFHCKPILRPISDLSKNEFPFKIGTYTSDFEFILEDTEFQLFEKMLELHFDIFGLIEKGIAISIHDVEQAE